VEAIARRCVLAPDSIIVGDAIPILG
jgi:hypothetical protein